MGKLKPVGSEKLEGMAKIQRMIEIARYKETKPQSINEDSSNEYSISLPDGYQYYIIKEKNGYIIKKGLNESSLDYMEPLKGRKYFSSYSAALKRLNIMTKEINSMEGNDRNVSLFTEGNEEGKKYYLSMKRKITSEQAPPTEAPQPQPQAQPQAQPQSSPTPQPQSAAPIPEPEMPTDDMSAETPPPPTEDEMGGAEEMPTPEPGKEGEEEVVTFKTIQKLTGKLGQKLRALNADEENQMSSKDIKYVINSILSALELENLEDEDREQIMNKFEGMEEEGGEEMDMGTEEIPAPEEEDMDMGTEESPAPEAEATPPQPPSDEVTEYHSLDDEDGMSHYKKLRHSNMGHRESNKMEDMLENIFSESKVDKIIRKYFKIDEKEKKFLNESKKKQLNVLNLTETVSQKVATKKFIQENKNVKFLGVTKRNDIVFKIGSEKVRITVKGEII